MSDKEASASISTSSLDVEALIHTLQEELHQTDTLRAVKDLRVTYLGKKSTLSTASSLLRTLPVDERKSFGQLLNKAKQDAACLIDKAEQIFAQKERDAALSAEAVDVTLEPHSHVKGMLHPVTRATEELCAIFAQMGFTVAEGPEIEDEFHNFTALNMPADHPARDMQDTFYLDTGNMDDTGNNGRSLLRTHTSSVQIRALAGKEPPLRIIAPGRVYRSDYDATHTPMFHQIEGVYIDKHVHMGHLKSCLRRALAAFFGRDDVNIYFRPSFFPFTEPSAEVDIACVYDKKNIKVGSGDDRMEVLGCGMMHPQVLRHLDIDPEEYQGFAFGIGIERMAMLKYNIPDLRSFFNPDMRWLKHYGFSAASVAGASEGVN